ncbi:13796_t:CDS:1, partial [Ambispora leptoticha]
RMRSDFQIHSMYVSKPEPNARVIMSFRNNSTRQQKKEQWVP